MIIYTLKSYDGDRAGSISWEHGGEPVVAAGSLSPGEVAAVRAVMEEPYEVLTTGEGVLDGGELSTHHARDSVAAFEYAVSMLPGQAWVTPEQHPATI